MQIMGGGREAFRHRYVLFWGYFGVIRYAFLLFFLMQFEFVWPRADSRNQSEEEKKRGNSV